ncbi:hypothetical protein PDPUS_1_00450 [Photobacterium damselae subsp. piscicida]|uniref:SMODS and SLOG-associating 2TM effector domain-containing protein n=1 Tax=Photobacterium damsela subsp. piscicida TaxID=38294 RepID=A0A1V1V855_PHODP|nr:hypothetical protein [Photobacterium damselae]MBE8130185.1 hypothetical protein [Photobacterium damselae subsp. piscicida]MDP2515616.1 hypothetical protein [Photobacterium damselae subsp. piscicida]MDP2532072.1 hypothetical protein [Photobacterium damselae subsp. piscicida]MDP2543263.1 hypothetical protein [Photobacterium damselae subsp. piscicida]MDP2556286.1 hypothetical protein [Photobacterium damselae subsp. piscicida]
MDDKEFELEKLKLNVDVWKKVVDVQQHFNDLEMKVRNFGFLIISAFISAIGVSLKSQYSAVVFDYNVPVAAFLSFGALVLWCFGCLDFGLFHGCLLVSPSANWLG